MRKVLNAALKEKESNHYEKFYLKEIDNFLNAHTKL